MKYKKIIVIAIILIQSIIIFALLLSKNRTDRTENGDPTDIVSSFHAPTIFVELEMLDMNTVTLGLWPIDLDDEAFSEFGWIRHGYTYFDFIGDGTLSKVIFSNESNLVDGPDFAIGMDTQVHVEIDGEWHSEWFFSTELVLTMVAPYMYNGIRTLLVVGYDVGFNYSAHLVVIRGGELEVLSMRTE